MLKRNSDIKNDLKKHNKLDFNKMKMNFIVGSEEISPLRSWTGSRNLSH